MIVSKADDVDVDEVAAARARKNELAQVKKKELDLLRYCTSNDVDNNKDNNKDDNNDDDKDDKEGMGDDNNDRGKPDNYDSEEWWDIVPLTGKVPMVTTPQSRL